ncbi:Hypothetical protein HVR_LOCUS602 [uncultured virus]|nr:Hypothetical protein HVR_LOCUS602 [uncultured virus]
MKHIVLLVVLLGLVSFTCAANKEDKHDTKCVGTPVGAYYKLSRLSPQDTVKALDLLDAEKHDEFIILTNIHVENFNSTEVSGLRCSISETLLAHYNHQSWFMKVLGLFTFYNIVSVLAVCTFAVFIILLCKDIAFFVAIYVGTFIIQLLFSARMLEFGGVILSILFLCFKGPPCSYVRYAFFFDEYTPFLGLLIFAGTSWYIGSEVLDALRNNKGTSKKVKNHHEKYMRGGPISDEDAIAALMILWVVVGSLVTVYHDHWILGVVTVLILFGRCGFFAKSFSGGYHVGFNSTQGLINCLVVAKILVPGYIFIRMNLPDTYHVLRSFETGVVFWGPLVGLLCVLILSDWDYVKREMNASAGAFLWLQCVMFIDCLCTMYFGTVLNIDCLKNIGGTYLVLWAMDLQRVMVSQFKNISLTPIFFLAFANLALLRYWIINFPEYFIIG